MRLSLLGIICLGALLITSCSIKHSADNRYLNNLVQAKPYDLPNNLKGTSEYPVPAMPTKANKKPSIIPPGTDILKYQATLHKKHA